MEQEIMQTVQGIEGDLLTISEIAHNLINQLRGTRQQDKLPIIMAMSKSIDEAVQCADQARAAIR